METMTVTDALRITANLLGDINVPRKLNEQIGIPIDRAISNINACIEALERKPEEAPEEEPESDNEDADEAAE